MSVSDVKSIYCIAWMVCWWRVCYKGSNKLRDVQSAEWLLECRTPSINFKAQMGICDWMRGKKRPGMGVSFGVMIDEYLGATLIGGIAKKEAWWWLWMKKKKKGGWVVVGCLEYVLTDIIFITSSSVLVVNSTVCSKLSYSPFVLSTSLPPCFILWCPLCAA